MIHQNSNNEVLVILYVHIFVCVSTSFGLNFKQESAYIKTMILHVDFFPHAASENIAFLRQTLAEHIIVNRPNFEVLRCVFQNC